MLIHTDTTVSDSPSGLFLICGGCLNFFSGVKQTAVKTLNSSVICLVLKLLIFAFLLDSISYSAMCKTAMQIQLKIHCQTGMHRVFFNKRNTSRNIGFGVFKLESSPFKQCDNLKTYTYVILHILCDCICRITRSERFYLFLFFLVL